MRGGLRCTRDLTVMGGYERTNVCDRLNPQAGAGGEAGHRD